KLRVGVDIPKPEEIDALLKASTGRWRPLLLVAVRCGLRASELRGLRWADVDLSKGELTVSQRADRFNKIGMPKSHAGERTIPIPPTTVNRLREWKLAGRRGEFVFSNGVGKVESLTNIVQRGLIPTWQAAGVTGRYKGMHALRHYFASWCLARPPVGLGLTL